MEAKRSTLKQYVFCLLAYLPATAPSASLGFSAVIIPILNSKLSIDQISWIASSQALAAPVGCLTAGYFTDKFGRLGALQVINVVSILGWSLVTLAYYMDVEYQYSILILGRVITGLSTGLTSICPIYLAEVSSTTLRPFFTTISAMFYSIGILIVYIYGYIFQENWGVIAMLCLIYPIISIILLKLFLPESPVWLISKGRVEQAQHNMGLIFGKKGLPIVKGEIDALIVYHEKSKQMLEDNSKTNKLQMFKERRIYYPFVIMIIYFGIQQFSGVMVIVFYAIDIAEDIQVTLDAYIVILLIAITRVLTALVASLTSRKIGRRLTSIISGVGVSIALYGLALYIILIRKMDKTDIPEAIPLILILLFVMLSTYGFLTIPFAMIPEMFPIKVRGFMVGLTIGINYVMCFIATKIYPIIREETESYWIFIIYGTVAVIGTIYLAIFLPETNGKTLPEIEELFMKKITK